jgi:hypothetical protein
LERCYLAHHWNCLHCHARAAHLLDPWTGRTDRYYFMAVSLQRFDLIKQQKPYRNVSSRDLRDF